MIECADGRRMHVLFFSTQGMRSLADKIAGKDYDGDECYLINWQELVGLCTNMQPPYDPHKPPALPPVTVSTSIGKRKASGAAGRRTVPRVAGSANAAGASRSVCTSSSSPPSSPTPSHALTRSTSELGQRLTFNFIWARFLCTPLVQTAGRQWMVFTDRSPLGARSKESLQIDRLYRLGLDENDPPALTSFTDAGLAGHLKHYPSSLRCKLYPEHMDAKIRESNARAHASGVTPSIKSAPSRTTLLAKLWHAPDEQWLQAPGYAHGLKHIYATLTPACADASACLASAETDGGVCVCVLMRPQGARGALGSAPYTQDVGAP
jgi:hypothetical protein